MNSEHYPDPTAEKGIERAMFLCCKDCQRVLLKNKTAKGKVLIKCPKCGKKHEYKL